MVDHYKRSATLAEHPRVIEAARLAPCDEYGADALLMFDEILAANRLGDHDGVLPVHATSPQYLGRRLLTLRWDLFRVQTALELCLQVGLVVRLDTGELAIPSWGDAWRPSRTDAERARASRERAKRLADRAEQRAASRSHRDAPSHGHRDAAETAFDYGGATVKTTTRAPSRSHRDTVTPNQSVSQSVSTRPSPHPPRPRKLDPPNRSTEMDGWGDGKGSPQTAEQALSAPAVPNGGDVHQTEPLHTPPESTSNRTSPGGGQSGVPSIGSPGAEGVVDQVPARVAPNAEQLGAPLLLAALQAHSIGLAEPQAAQAVRATTLAAAGLTVSDIEKLNAQAERESNKDDHRGLLAYWLTDPKGLAAQALKRADERALAQRNAAVRPSTEVTPAEIRRRWQAEDAERAKLPSFAQGLSQARLSRHDDNVTLSRSEPNGPNAQAVS